jgi:cytochrome P450
MVDYAEQIQSRWAIDSVIDVAYEMMRLTLWIVGKTLFDADVLDEAEDLGKTLADIGRIAEDMINALVHLPASWPTPRNRQFSRAIARLDSTIYHMIDARRQSGDTRHDVLGILLRARDEDDGSFMTDQQVRDEAVTLFLAGHTTVATALAWTWYLLAQHPQVYSRMCTEVDHVLAGRTPTLDDLPHLPYTLQVFKEAMRLYPPAFAILRRAVRPIEIGQYMIPSGMRVAISPYTLHRRPDYFPNPACFDPERFTLEAEAHRPRYAFLPFGAGPRICIGNHFALMEGHLILATLAQHVMFELVSGQQIEPEAQSSLTPERGIKVRVRRR